MNTQRNYPVSELIRGLAAATGSAHPMRRDDYRQPIRRSMLIDARRALLELYECPPMRAGSLSLLPMSELSTHLRRVEARRAASALEPARGGAA